jgi:hypothetical protein
MTAIQAANVKAGESVNVDGIVGPADELSQVVPRQTEGEAPADARPGAVGFSFTVSAGAAPALVRWDQDGIHFFRGKILPADTVERAFAPSPKN